MAELANLFTVEFADECPTPWPSLVLTFHNGKINQHRRMEYCAAVWIKDFLVCSLGAVDAYFFWRWHCTEEFFPSFMRREDWYTTQVQVGSFKDRTKELSYNTQLKWTSQSFTGAELWIRKKTHAERRSGARIAELVGVLRLRYMSFFLASPG